MQKMQKRHYKHKSEVKTAAGVIRREERRRKVPELCLALAKLA
jgi:hypothetical protein